MTHREHNHGKAKARNKSRVCFLKWPDDSEEQVRYIANGGTGFAIVERDDLDDDGKRERIEVLLAQLEWR